MQPIKAEAGPKKVAVGVMAVAVSFCLIFALASQVSAQTPAADAARAQALERRAAAEALRAQVNAGRAGGVAVVGVTAPPVAGPVVGEEIGSLRGVPLPEHVVSLDGVVSPAGMATLIKDNEWAIVLGKALFWDEQVGSDGMACASCHFSAGADPRGKNQLTPGLNDLRFPGGDTEFGGLEQAQGTVANDIPHLSPAGTAGLTAGGQVAGPNITLGPDDFPLHKLADIGEHNADILYTTNDVVSSSGTTDGAFIAVNEAGGFDDCGPADPTVFHNGHGLAARKVEPRNTPTVINAAFNFENFWDGRAKNIFNGVDPFGNRTILANPAARIVRVTSELAPGRRVPLSADLGLTALRVTNSSLASQAVGPPGSDFEMSCAGRQLRHIGTKLIPNRALKFQRVHAQDSVLGRLSAAGRFFLTYKRLIQLAFDDSLWAGRGEYVIQSTADTAELVKVRSGGFTQMELNFAMFFGLAIQAYEETLISDDSPFDRHFDDLPGLPALTPAQLRGLAVFTGPGLCNDCHNTPVLTGASTISMGLEGVLERMPMGGDNGALNPGAVYDNGFYNIGVTRTVADRGRGATGPFGAPLSFARQFVRVLQGIPPVDPMGVDVCGFEAAFAATAFLPLNSASQVGFTPVDCGDGVVGVEPVLVGTPGAVDTNALNRNDRRNFVVAVDGSFKVPTIRNVGLTGPYMHDGSMKSLEEVVQFYSRAGNYRSHFLYDTLDALIGDQHACAQVDGPGDIGNSTGTGLLGQCPPVNNQLRGSNFDPAIIELGLTPQQQSDLVQFLLSATDRRVACAKAPFDHPSLTIRNGASLIDSNGDGRADDIVSFLQPVGAGGRRAEGLTCLPNTGNFFNEQTLINEATAAPLR